MLLRVTPKTVVKEPPMRILPSGWTTATWTSPFAFGSKPSSADCPRTAAAPPASAKPTSAIKLNRANEPNLFFAKFFIFGLSFGSRPRGYLEERPGVNRVLTRRLQNREEQRSAESVQPVHFHQRNPSSAIYAAHDRGVISQRECSHNRRFKII